MLLKFSKILVAVLSVILIGLIIYIVVKKGPTEKTDTENKQTFVHSVVTGFEGVYPETEIKLDYPGGKIVLRSFGGKLLFREVATDKIGEVRIIDNSGAGFPTPQEAFQYTHLCDECKPTSNDIQFSDAKDTAAYSDAENTWYIFTHDPGFVAVRAPKESPEIKKMLTSLKVRTVKVGNEMPELAKLNVYFTNEKIKPVKNCTEVVPVERYYVKTPQVATMAILMLLDGLYQGEEIDKGYTTNIPKGVWLNSIEIKDGIAYVDFSKKLEEGGGSCHMAALSAQINQTLLQFPAVKSVKISIEGRTEDILQP